MDEGGAGGGGAAPDLVLVEGHEHRLHKRGEVEARARGAPLRKVLALAVVSCAEQGAV